jgi:hypothetical protein
MLDNMVYAISVIKKWLRALIGWGELSQAVRDNDAKTADNTRSIKALDERIEGHESRLLRLQRRADSASAHITVDWEAQQIAFLSDPANFKEEN